MPQASDEDRDWIEQHFGERAGDRGPVHFLKCAGYRLMPDWRWQLPTPIHKMTYWEARCIDFLIDEWDFGGVIRPDVHFVPERTVT